MALKIVGAGFGRTGTKSLKFALDQLGFGPCHHMFELHEHPEQVPLWQAAARGETMDWDAVFAGYTSCVDWPAAHYWREIAAHYPHAKVLLSVRPAEAWFKSISATIYRSIMRRDSDPPGVTRDRRDMSYEITIRQTFGGRLDDRDHALSVFRAHIEEVQRTIAPDRLLTFDVTEGWEPLCTFLGVPIPDAPFPRTNTTAEFQARLLDNNQNGHKA
jgi:hypothetical protein